MLQTPRISAASEKIERELSDITLTYGDSIVMVETNAVWLRNDLLGSDDTEKFWDHLMEKFGVTVKSNATKDERKGVAQLADSIKALGLADCKFSDPELLPKTLTTIYPVLLVHDSLMNATGFANLLATVFAQLFDQPDVTLTGFFQHKDFRIANLTLATVDEIENLIGTGSKDSFLTHLARFNKFDPGRLLKSLDDYVHESVAKGPVPSSPLTDSCKWILDFARPKLFPGA